MGFAITFILYKANHLELTPYGSLGNENLYLVIFLNGLFSAGSVWLTHSLQEFLERGFSKD